MIKNNHSSSLKKHPSTGFQATEFNLVRNDRYFLFVRLACTICLSKSKKTKFALNKFGQGHKCYLIDVFSSLSVLFDDCSLLTLHTISILV